ncbi:MAG TPA: thioredoxin domain-containing protein [Blastocatellia bacterium]|nr:thioredoxin domain-containing protein [Blastocatellia bacterium]
MKKKYFPFLLIFGVLIISIGGGALLYNSQAHVEVASGSGGSTLTPPPLHPGAEPAHLRGDSQAPVVLEEFGDFQCPVCGRFYKDLKMVEAEYGSKLRVIFREFPIQSIHPHSLEAAHAAEAAGLQGKFWEMHDLLYENQDIWVKEANPRATFDTYAKGIGLNVNQFDNDMNGSVVAGRCISDQVKARDMGVNGTPSIFIDGKPPRDKNIDAIRNAINEELKAKGL